MAIMRWDPFGEMLRMQRDMDRIFSRMGSPASGERGEMSWMPKINVKQTGDDISVHVELAGIKPEDVDIEVTDGVLNIRGERKEAQEREDEGWLVKESSYGSFQRSMVLPEGVDPGSIKADFHDGMLEIHVPKAMEAAKPKTTRVSVGGTQQAAMGSAGQGKETTQEPQGQQQAGGQQQGQQGQPAGPQTGQQTSEQSREREKEHAVPMG